MVRQPERLPRLGAGVQPGADPLVVGGELGHRTGDLSRVQADQRGAAPLLGHERVKVGRRDRHAAPPGDIGVGAHLAAVHPEQQFGLVQPEPRTVGIRPPQRGVDLPDPARGPLGLGRAAVGADPDELAGPNEPAHGLLAVQERRVLPGAPHHPGMQRLQVERAEPGHPHHRLVHDPPGHRARTEQAMVGGRRIGTPLVTAGAPASPGRCHGAAPFLPLRQRGTVSSLSQLRKDGEPATMGSATISGSS